MDARNLGGSGSAGNAIGSSNFNMGNPLGGLSQFLQGLLIDQSVPYKESAKEYSRNINQGVNVLNPFYDRGVGAGENYEDKLNKMKDSPGYINDLIRQYQESPYTQFLKQQGQRYLTNAGSASGLTGSSALQKAGLDYMNQISQSGLNDWLSRVLGVDKDYLSGISDIYGKGYSSGQNISNLYGQSAQDLANLKYNQEAGNLKNSGNLLSGFLDFGSSLLGLL